MQCDYFAVNLRSTGRSSLSASNVVSISSMVVKTEKLKRIVDDSSSFGIPMAVKVAEGCGLWEEQALPADT